MRCEELETILFSGREILPEERENMRRHAERCEPCRVLMEQADVLAGARTLNADVEVPESFARGWRAAVRERAKHPTAAQRLAAWAHGAAGRGFAVRAAAYACCAVVLLGVGARLGAGTPQAYGKRAGGVSEYQIMAEEMDGGVMMSRGMSGMPEAGTDDSWDSGRRIVRSAQLEMTTDAFDAALEEVSAQTAAAGGSITSCDVIGTPEDGRYANIELSIPEEALDGFMAKTGVLGTVTREYSQALDMTSQYQDNASRLESARAQKQRLDELYQSAQSMEDIVAITNALFEVQQQIDSLTGANNSIDQRAANAQISLSITEVVAQEEPDAPLTQQLAHQAGQGVQALGEFLSGALLFAAWALPWLGAAGVLMLAVLVIMRMRRRR